jgi:DNA-binding YbaB/EbfC family protein
MNIQQMMKQAQAMQKKIAEIQEKAGQTEVEGSAGGGLVRFVMNGKGEAKSLKIDAKVVDPSDIETLEDMVIAAYNDAKRKSDENMQNEMSAITGGLPPGFKLPF